MRDSIDFDRVIDQDFSLFNTDVDLADDASSEINRNRMYTERRRNFEDFMEMQKIKDDIGFINDN